MASTAREVIVVIPLLAHRSHLAKPALLTPSGQLLGCAVATGAHCSVAPRNVAFTLSGVKGTARDAHLCE
jgi:hypothetical protein